MIHREDMKQAEQRRLGSRQALFLIVGVLTLALALRLYRLDAQSLWNDEGTTVQLVGADLGTITRLAASDIHPPFYYYALHFWTSIFGKSEFAVPGISEKRESFANPS